MTTSFEGNGAGSVRAVVADAMKRLVRRSATVHLPATAAGAAQVEDDASHVAVRFALEGASESPLEEANGVALYRAGYHGGDIVQRPHAEGTEDYVVFDARPADESLAYDVDVSRAAGLRLVGNVLELMDEGGAPRLRVATPHVVDRAGSHGATLSVEGCAFDTNPAGPWGRPVTRPGASTCRVRVGWHGASYPALVDPQWSATGSMTTPRENHTATLLTSGPNAGKVLIAGGCSDCSSGATLSSAELFDGTSSFAATSSMHDARRYHTATLLTTGANAGSVLLAGGFYLSSAELYDGTSTFTPTGSMTTGRQWHTATALPSGQVLIAGGFNGSYLSSAELFDGTSVFTLTGPMTAVRSNHTATLLTSGPNAGKVLVAGGTQGASGEVSSAELFDGTSAFKPTGSMTTARFNHTATLLPSGMVLIAGGATVNGDTELSSAELFDGTSAFNATGFMASMRESHTATLLTSGPNAGKVLVAGGDYDGDAGTTPIAGAELFDGTSSFTPTSPMTTARSNATATVLPSGQVLVAGGEVTANEPLSSAELFLLAAGEACDAGADCVPGACVDGVCCNSTCAGQCEACDVAGSVGTCTGVSGAPHGTRAACGGEAACAGTCNGAASTAACAYPGAATSCGRACASGQETDSQCDGDGGCVAEPPTSCGAYACSGEACATSCATMADCASGLACLDGGCEPPRPVDAGSDSGGTMGAADAAIAAEAGDDSGASTVPVHDDGGTTTASDSGTAPTGPADADAGVDSGASACSGRTCPEAAASATSSGGGGCSATSRHEDPGGGALAVFGIVAGALRARRQARRGGSKPSSPLVSRA